MSDMKWTSEMAAEGAAVFAKATPRPWKIDDTAYSGRRICDGRCGGDEHLDCSTVAGEVDEHGTIDAAAAEANAVAVVFAVNNMPAAMARIEELENALRDLQAREEAGR